MGFNQLIQDGSDIYFSMLQIHLLIGPSPSGKTTIIQGVCETYGDLLDVCYEPYRRLDAYNKWGLYDRWSEGSRRWLRPIRFLEPEPHRLTT